MTFLLPAVHLGRVPSRVVSPEVLPRPATAITHSATDLFPHSAPLHPSRWSRRPAPMLYVSGNEENRIVFTRLARRWEPIKVLLAKGGQQGVSFTERRLCLVVMDAALPDMDASLFARFLHKQCRPSIPPVLVLGHDSNSKEHARFVRAGATAYVPRPFDVARLDETVMQLLNPDTPA